MYTKQDILNIYNNDDLQDFVKRLEISSIISQELAENGCTAVMVGGSAVEFYTWASYATQDVDFIVTDPTNVKKCMEGLGFENHSAVWEFPETDIIIEFPKGPLFGTHEKVLQVNTRVGPLNVIGIEDIIIDRSARKQYWGDADEWAKYMIMAHHDSLDWDYLKKQAIKACCSETLNHFKKYYKKELGDISEQNPKRQKTLLSNHYHNYINEILQFSKKVTSKSLNKDLYFYFAKQVLLDKSDSVWTNNDNEKVIRNMLENGIDIYKVKKCLEYSPAFVGLSNLERMVKSKEAWNEVVKNNQHIKKLINNLER